LLLVLLNANNSRADTRYVPSEYPTIQAALDAAAVWDTVLVAPGVYSDTVSAVVGGNMKTVNAHIAWPVYLFAEDPAQMPHIDGSASDIGIYVDNATCEIRGFEITTTLAGYGCVLGEQGSIEISQPLEDDIGVRCDNGYVTISDSRIHEHLRGVELNSATATIERCEVYRSAIGVQSTASPVTVITECDFQNDGIMVEADQSLVYVDCCKFYRQGDFACTALSFYQSDATITNNTIESLMVEGITIAVSTGLIASNTIEDCKSGLIMTFDDSLIVRQNLFRENPLSMDIRSCVGSTVENNIFADTGTALICQWYDSDPLIQQNIFYNQYVGIACVNNPKPTIRCNDIFNTPEPYYGDCSDQTGINGNFSMEPQFCAPANGDFTLQPDSPCAPGNHPDGVDCGLIGAFGVSCVDVPTAKTSWGRLKSLYRSE